jgi:hypothetical protein
MTEGDRYRFLGMRDYCVDDLGTPLAVCVGRIFDALANDDLAAAQDAGRAYVDALDLETADV